MRSILSLGLGTTREQGSNGSRRTHLYLNVYDLTPINNYLYWFGLGIFHSGIEAHGMEYAFGAHEYPTSGVFEVEPKSCPGFIYRRSVWLGSTNLSPSEFRLFMEHLSGTYHGDTYHLISKNCNHFTDDVCTRLTGKRIPGWVNRLARLGKNHSQITFSGSKITTFIHVSTHLEVSGSFCNCLLPESIQVTAVSHLPLHATDSAEDGSESIASHGATESDEEVDHHLLTLPNGDVEFLFEKPVKLSRELM
ncbi:deSI-like protein [Cinnamomum micranthum f. kanehirae]|uniref:DeSI-like protein n=1 Tax=Cinnamomum micranthum f. kanehirae TaxID=337451 RepID=A0A3S5WGN7_9MAGN|nr:deSI-like protein [Cinnamomum micranthum f. kanehirae]